MSEQPYTPPTDEVRGAYQAWNQDIGGDPYMPEQSGAEFDRWLAGIKADARREGWDHALMKAERMGYMHAARAAELESSNPYRQEATR